MTNKIINIPKTKEPRLQTKPDAVTFWVKSENDQWCEHRHRACYMDVMLPIINGASIKIKCVPTNDVKGHEGTSALTRDEYFEWMRLCKKHNLVPQNAKVNRHKNKNILEISCDRFDRHILYAALCCYRWSENCPGMVWQILQHLSHYPKIHFWQAFQYTMVVNSYNGNHNFISIPFGTEVDLRKGVICRWFFGLKPIKDRKKKKGPTSTVLDNEIKSIAPLIVSGCMNLLDDKWSALYRFKNIREVNKIFKGIK